MSLISIFYFLLGLIVITVGSEILLKGASKIASLLNVRPIVIGLTVVSIGTSLPEFAVGVLAVREGAGDLAIGNIAGTNLVNILFILGLSATIRPLSLKMKSIRADVIAMIVAALTLFFLSLDGRLNQWDGILMLAMGVGYMIFIVRHSRKESRDIHREYREEYEVSTSSEKANLQVWTWNAILLVGGIAATLYGADKMIEGAVDIARYLGMSDAVIGLTIVAIGTSAPELATTLVATFKDDRDVAIGNLMGSSIMNILFILSGIVLITPGGMPIAENILWIDLPLVALVAIVCYPVFKSGQAVSRREGIVFVLLYLAYLGYLLMVRT